MSKPKEPYLPLFFGDFLASTAYWRGEEQALYLLLLGYQWASGPLPPNPDDIAQVVRYESRQFAKLWVRVGTKFTKGTAGLVNERLEEVRKKAHQISTKNSDSGKQGAAARWRKNGERHASANGADMANAIHDAIETPMADGMTLGCGSNPNQIRTKNKKLTKEEIEEKEPLQ